ncbi:uncharacterized protein LOC124700705 isoform X1 [Lolium rigidum]|uniref:uncharacterized protein LOC124700705 isoform X1 n=1 Tax=Lolium rigidum TaxID=89674 RepID=UPI001F5CC3BD|nr:uncharacterized protein LOC124700705 isoform X1 [Lolium rigidum]
MDKDVEQQNTSRRMPPRFNAGSTKRTETVSTSRLLQQGSIQHDIMTDGETNYSLYGEHEQDNSTKVDITQCASTSSGQTSSLQVQETLLMKLQSLENGYNVQREKIIKYYDNRLKAKLAELNKKKMADMSVLLAEHATSQTSSLPSESEKEDINPANTSLAKSTSTVGGCVMENQPIPSPQVANNSMTAPAPEVVDQNCQASNEVAGGECTFGFPEDDKFYTAKPHLGQQHDPPSASCNESQAAATLKSYIDHLDRSLPPASEAAIQTESPEFMEDAVQLTHAASAEAMLVSQSEGDEDDPTLHVVNHSMTSQVCAISPWFVEVNYHKDMNPENGSPAPKLPDDLVVEVLSRLPFKSFCRFKCVSKDWLAFSSDPHYSKKLLKIPTGLLYQRRDNSAIMLASLPHNDKEFDEALSFLPQYEQLELKDSCNGLVLCKYKSSYTPVGICRFIVCNPATREWRVLPDTPRSHYDPFYNMSILAFSPSWSAKFYIFNFQRLSTRYLGFGPGKLQVYSSDLSTWFVDDTSWLYERRVVSQPHLFIDGALYVRRDLHEILVLKRLEGISHGIPPTLRIIELPHEDVGFMDRIGKGCLGQSSGALHYAVPEEDARTILVWSLDVDEPYEWSLKYRLSMSHAFGTDNLRRYDTYCWNCDYDVMALDLERDGLVMFDKRADKLRWYSISTGELTEIQPEDHRCDKLSDKHYHYVASYSKLPVLTM